VSCPSSQGWAPRRPKSSKLRKKDTKVPSAGFDISKAGPEVVEGGFGDKPGAVPSLMMADWEIAPGRIRVGSGQDAESELHPSRFRLDSLVVLLGLGQLSPLERHNLDPTNDLTRL
jgi:hypothetical protein